MLFATVPAADLREVCVVLLQALLVDFLDIFLVNFAVERARTLADVVHLYRFDLPAIVIQCQIKRVLAAYDWPVLIHDASLLDPEEIAAVACLAHTHCFLISFSRAELYPRNLPGRTSEVRLLEELDESLCGHPRAIHQPVSVIVCNRYPQATTGTALVTAKLQKLRSFNLIVIVGLYF